MDELIAEAVEVEHAADSPRPLRFRWRNEVHEVVEIDREWVDTGYGSLPRRSRRWFNRRHRRCFVVRDAKGERFMLYLDYSDRSRPTWFLASRIAGGA
jgi:hypothetical protein